jgi:hypothetical protein
MRAYRWAAADNDGKRVSVFHTVPTNKGASADSERLLPRLHRPTKHADN